MSSASIEFFVPGAGEPVVFELDPVMVYVWEYQLLNPKPDLSEMVSIRFEGKGLTQIPRYGAFRTSYEGLDPVKGFDGNGVLYMLSEFKPRWESGLIEFRADGRIAPSPLQLSEYHSWDSLIERAAEGAQTPVWRQSL